MNRSIIYLILFASAAISGCAAHRANIIIDPVGVDMQQYQNDLAQCHIIARQVRHRAGRGAVGGAIVGGAVGGIVGNRDTAKKVAGVGAVGGLARGAAVTRYERRIVVRNCLQNRGYSVLN